METSESMGMAFVSAPVGEAESIAREIVLRKLAACAQVTAPMSSIYWWNGKMETEPERLILLKTRRALLPDLKSLLQQVHPYELPELIFVPITDGSDEYLAWVAQVLP